MDYDEKDFQSHNFQLVGEDNFSTNLRSFALPRFDIDEHIRFDSLVEEEVLLGIQDQENNWIDFPPGSSAIEFSSSAAESCSIARDNNVWSEATSSESVDLLLKSVGEDEMINNKFIMEASANEESHGIDNQADLYVEKDDSHESSMMDILPVDPELAQDKLQENLSGSNEGQREMLPNAEGSTQAAAGEESRIAMYIHSSNRKFSSDGKIAGVLYTIGDHITSFCNAIEKSKVDDTGLCEAVLNEKDVCEMLMRTEAPSIDDSNSCEVDNQNMESNQDVKLYMETEKLNTGLFSVGQDQRNISNSSDFLCDDAHTEKSLAVYNDDKKNHEFVSKSGSLVPLNTKCIDSVFPENSDVSAVAVPCQTKSLNGNSETCEIFFTEECMSRLAMEQEGKNEHNSVTASSKAILKRLTQLAEGYSSVGDRLPNDSVEDVVHGTGTQLIKNSALSCDDRGVTLETCIDAIDNKQYPEGQLVESRSTDVENATPLLTDSPDSVHVNYETQVTDNEDCKRMNTNPLSFTCDKSGLVVEGNSDKDMDVDRQEVKLDETKDVAPDESLPISVTEESALLITMTDTEFRTSPSTYCESSVCMEAISVTDLTEVHMAQVHVSVDKDPSLTYMGPGRINSSPISKVMEKVQDLPPAVPDAAEELSLDGSANKLVDEELDSVPLSPEFEKSSSLLLSTPEHATNVDLAVGKKESLIQVSPANTIHSDGKDVKISGVVVSSLSTTDLVVEKESDLASVSYPLNMKDASPEKIPQAAQLASPVKSPYSQLSKCTGGLNLTMEQKDEPSSCLIIPESCASEENELKLSGGSMLSNSRNNVDEETVNGAVTGSDCVEYALVDSSTEHLPLAVVQPPSPVRSSCFTLPQNDIPSSAGNAVGSGKTLLLERNGISHASSREANDDILNSLEVVPHAMNEASVALAKTANGRQAPHMPPSMDKECSCESPSNAQNDQYKLAERDVSDGQNVSAQTEDKLLSKRMNDSSQICTRSTAESNSSEAQSGNSSSERNFVSPIVSNCIGSPGDASAHHELKVSDNMPLVSSENDEITHKVDCSSGNLHVTSVDDRSFTLEVSTSEDLPERGAGIELSFHNLKANDIPQTPNENSPSLPEDVKVLDSSTRTHNQEKSKNVSRPSNEKTTALKGKPKKEPHALKKSSGLDVKYSSFTRKSVGTLSKDIPLVEMQEHSSNECSTIKSSSSLAVKTSSIPDLNSSSSLALFHQPFTDLQQVQLRAQIFVYGALISGMPPDETYMVSAFGDGGRNLWEGLWHASTVRFQNQKSPVGSYDTPNSRPAIWIPEQVSMGSDVQSKVPSTSSAKSDSIVISSAVLNSTVPLPSPLWSLSYGNDGQHASLSRGTYLSFSHSPSPLAHQTSVSRQHVGVSSPWLSQSPRPGPWSVSSQISALDGITRYSTVPVTETGHVTPIRDSCGLHTPTIQVGHPSVLMSVPDTAATTTAADLHRETSKREATSGNNKYIPITQKARKRRKGEAAEEPTLPASQTLAESVSALPLPSASMLLSSNSQLNVASHAPVSISAPHIIYPTQYQIASTNNNQQKTILSEETCSKIEQAKLQAENATALAASTVKHSQDIWSQLAAQKNSGLSSQFEEKLASAAVAAAAAASVAKAAAAAANVAFGAALQAKMMVDEAMSAEKTGNTAFNQESGILDVGKKLAGISPVSILKGMDKIHGSGAIISAASEAARRKVESASAAMKRAENLNSILKAAELAAEAVAQAGTIIAMGDPLPFTLRDLVDAGPEGFWRGHDVSSTKLSKASSMHGEEHLGLGSAKEHGGSDKKFDDQFSKDKETQKVADEGGLSYLNECHEQFEGRSQGNFSSTGHEKEHPVIFSSIQKGSVVEVMSDGDGLKGAWFLARVLDMDDNRAYVCYNDVSTTEGHLKEWIVLEKGEKAPRIRSAHSTTLIKYEGTRKRRREHLGSYIGEVGDHVDAWMHDRWWEGTVTEKSPGDETKLTVHIPARDDTHVVNSWNLRPSLIWKDGQWSEWSHAKEKSFKAHEGDTPQEKRQKLGRLEAKNHSEVDASGMGKLSKNILMEESTKPDDSRSLVLSAKDRTFSIGKDSREEVISDTRKPKQTGLQKEGSRVVFGVPRPGKKRKFMEVSKHYVANKSEKSNEGNDSIKFAKYLMPQASRQSRSTSKVDNKGRKAVEIKPRGGFKAENYQSFRTRGLAEKDKASLPTSNEGTVHVYHKDATSSFKAVESEHSVQPAPAPLSKKSNTPGSETDLTVKPKSSMDGTSTVEDKDPGNPGKAMHEIMEPRRSNRRIQPTSRLLEGLQSSLVISKISGVSHERKLPRGGSVSRGNLR